MWVGPWGVCGQSDFSVEFFSAVKLWVENPLSVGQIDIWSDAEGSFIEKINFLSSELSVQNVEVFNQRSQVCSEKIVIDE